MRVAKRAIRMGYYGLAAVIAVAWDTQLSPGDVRDLRASQLARLGSGNAFFTERGKTGTPVGGILSLRSVAVMTAYLERLGVELHGDAYIFRNRSGTPTPATPSATTSATCVRSSSARSTAGTRCSRSTSR